MAKDETPAAPALTPDAPAAQTIVVPATGPVDVPDGPNPDQARADVETRLHREMLERAVQAPRTTVDKAPVTR